MIVIQPGKIHRQYLKDIWTYRELFLLLSWRDILVRYKQTVIGIAWSVIRPLLTMIVFTIIFGKLAKMPSDGMPYAVMVFSAMLPWQFFSNTISEGGNSLISNERLISKVYFPRIIIPTTSMIVSLIDFLISFFLLICIMLMMSFIPSWKIILIPILMIPAAVFALGLTYFISAMNVKYRDFRYVLPFIIQFGLYISPVGFSSSVVPENWRLLFYLNPMAGIIDLFRWAISAEPIILDFSYIALSLIITLIIFVVGVSYFRKTESEFADVI